MKVWVVETTVFIPETMEILTTGEEKTIMTELVGTYQKTRINKMLRDCGLDPLNYEIITRKREIEDGLI